MSFVFLLVYGVVVGLLAKFLHPGDDPIGLPSTLAVGILGSYVGGFINWLLGCGRGGPIHTSGILMGIIGGIICLAVWRWWNLQNSPSGPKSFWTGKLK